MRLIHFIFATLLALVAVIVWMLALPVPADAVGMAHPVHAAMKIGGDGSQRLSEVGNLPYVMQVIVLTLALLLIAHGVHPKQRTHGFWLAMCAVAITYQVVWWNIWFRYQAFLQSGELHYAFGFVTSTAWMILGIWLSGLGLLAIYVFGFRRFVFTHDSEVQFNQLLLDTQNSLNVPPSHGGNKSQHKESAS